MGKTHLYTLCIFALFIFVTINDCSPQIRTLREEQVNFLLIDDTVMINSGYLGIDITSVDYDLTGEVLQFISKNIENRDKGYSFNFKAIKKGEATLTLRLENLKNGEGEIINKIYKVTVLDESGLPEMSAAEIFQNPKNFTYGLFILKGTSYGWLDPHKIPKEPGVIKTISDWGFSDTSGFLYISGIDIGENGTKVKVIGNVYMEGEEWTFSGYKMMLDESEYTKVNAVEIFNDPEHFKYESYMMEGISRGWGNPVNTKVVWGKSQTRSDWVLEDSTGAIYISGIFVPEKGTEVKVFGNVVMSENDEWTFYGNNVLLKNSSGMRNLNNILKGKWTVRTINDKEVDKEKTQFGKMPYFEFGLKENGVSVFTECNYWNGRITVINDEISFNFFYGTLVGCFGEYESEIEETIDSEKAYKYKIEDDILTFSENGKTVMTLIKSDE